MLPRRLLRLTRAGACQCRLRNTTQSIAFHYDHIASCLDLGRGVNAIVGPTDAGRSNGRVDLRPDRASTRSKAARRPHQLKRAPIACDSFRNRLSAASSKSPDESTFSATSRRTDRWVARYTVAKPPLPRTAWIW